MMKSAPYISIVWPAFLDLMSYLGRKLGFLEITIWGLTLGWLVISREPMDEETERHESVHVCQLLELSILTSLASLVAFWSPLEIPFWMMVSALVWAWMPGINPGLMIYSLIWSWQRFALGKSGEQAYEDHPMEVEARIYGSGKYKIEDRPLFGWLI